MHAANFQGHAKYTVIPSKHYRRYSPRISMVMPATLFGATRDELPEAQFHAGNVGLRNCGEEKPGNCVGVGGSRSLRRAAML